MTLELKENYTVVIVTHNMQQAARISDNPAFFYLGELIEYSPTKVMFTRPTQNLNLSLIIIIGLGRAITVRLTSLSFTLQLRVLVTLLKIRPLKH